MKKILMYHSIGPNGKESVEIGQDLYTVSERIFRIQLEHLSNYNPDVTITFDDGYSNNYTSAYPVLKEMNTPAYFFILVSKVGTAGYMSWEQIKELANNGMIIGSHGMTHRILTDLSDKELDYEMGESKKILEGNLRCKIHYFSVPRGFYNGMVVKKARQFRYKAIFTSDQRDADGYRFGRIAVRANWDLERFAREIEGERSLRDRSAKLLLDSSKKILGPKYYDKVRTIILGEDEQ